MKPLNQVVEGLVSANGDLDLIAKFSVVDADEVAVALADANADSAEAVVLRLLAKYNPVTTVASAPVVQDANSQEA